MGDVSETRKLSALKRQNGPSRILHRRVPVIIQMSEVECGAACLAMILSYYGRHTRIVEIRQRIGIGRDGLSAFDLVNAARNYGLHVRAISLRNSYMHGLHLPAIIHWEFNHFLVVERWTSTHVDVVDPAQGHRRLTAEEFDAGFTGVVLLIEPNISFVRQAPKARATLYTYIVQYIKQSPTILFQILVASIVLQVLGLSVPLFTKIVVDQIIPFNIREIMPILGVGMLFLLLSQLVMVSLRSCLLIYLQARIDLQIFPQFFEHLLSLPLSFFQQRSNGDILTRIESNLTIRDLLSTQLISTFLDGSTVLVYFVILLTQARGYGFLVLLIGVLQVLLLLSSASPLRSLSLRELAAIGHTQGYVAEALSGIVTLKAAGAERRSFKQWSNLFVQQLNTSVRRRYFSALLSNLTRLLSTLTPSALLWWGTLLVLNGSMELGTMLALNTLAVALLSPLGSLVSGGMQLQIVRSHLERLSDVVEAEVEQDSQHVRQPPRLKGAITLEHVSFGYDRLSPLVLKDINVHIAAGETVAIVGPTGSGKTTLGKLLLGLYAPTTGEIRYDDIPLYSLNYQDVRMQFGSVMQEASIFSGSIRHNIALNNPDLDMEHIQNAARAAAIHDEIMSMPMGYETLVSEGGSALSGGQRQRLALARALAHSPAILLLDEATSSLDMKTERIVEQHLSSLTCTQIIIAHHLNTIRNADTILVLENGQLVEQGTHQQLLQRQGYYAELLHAQLASGEIRGVN
ncbi:NHLP family bacteriocin export ABC transporter peptidase/permease/ATPase [Reticulibacter mediterranei]|uniref:NHLP family bacteriocin export ABC transporter peptidase/permease/ATPase n=1 Tax=Reticulibacter mediterranei TaxID=2778369 RepID=A0A8J3N8M8_9CHLR|nr:peptidase domain-containing ABC transporter [Reticulibacter mediterranei]GHO99700.1 NHLP family bacteriocin export ABC transporter peptidase/permease/ATPase [Reticulibacter mediterranei]